MASAFDSETLKSRQKEIDTLLKQNATLEEIIRLDARRHVVADAHRSRSVLAELITIPQSQWFLDANRGQP